MRRDDRHQGGGRRGVAGAGVDRRRLPRRHSDHDGDWRIPDPLFITLAGVTLLFGMANVNGTLERLARARRRALPRQRRRDPGDVLLRGAGPLVDRPRQHRDRGAARADGDGRRRQAGVPPFLMALMVGNGAQAGALSPFAPTGVIVNEVLDKIGLAGEQWTPTATT